jgi:hypothetical protein
MTSLIHLWAIERARYQELEKKMVRHALEWNIQKKCQCVRHIDNPSLHNFIVCEHIEKDRIERFHKEIKKRYSTALKLSALEMIEVVKLSRGEKGRK